MDLSTSYLGFSLPHPFLSGAGPQADSLDMARRLEDSGAAAIVLRSLFEEQIRQDTLANLAARAPHEESFPEALSYSPEPEEWVFGPDEYLEHLRRVREAVQIPVIASLNGNTPGGWLDHARAIEQAGADALELNLYDVPRDPRVSSAELEELATGMLSTVRAAVKIPLAVKLSPFYTSLPHFARRLAQAGANGLVLFNRYFEPDIDIEELEVVTQLGMSSPTELLLRLRWLAILAGHVDCDLCASGGIHRATDAVKALMAGATAVQVVSALLVHGPEHLLALRHGLVEWLTEHEYESLAQMRGSMNIDRCPDPSAWARGNYMRVLQTFMADRL